MRTQAHLIAAIIVLHNAADSASVSFLQSCPTDGSVQVIDWYHDDAARYSYTGPPPSAFPTVVVPLPLGRLGTLRQPTDWKKDVAPLLKKPDTTKLETICNDGDFIGGQDADHVNELMNAVSDQGRAALKNTVPVSQALRKAIKHLQGK
ncbi:MAG: hypothetical protein KGL39_50300 [Patescibacteria group bacterium]|nr:hypothetical protein [Patescibacteria group bacterium]